MPLALSGSGGVGQAAITIALSFNCNVFTTVGSPAKKQFLLDTFPGVRWHSFRLGQLLPLNMHMMLIPNLIPWIEIG